MIKYEAKKVNGLSAKMVKPPKTFDTVSFAAIANASRGPDYYGDHRSSWERHVDRCYDRYRTYDESTDTYVGFDGQYHYCRL